MSQLLSEGSQRARAAFLARLEDLGGTLLDTEWRGTEVRYRARCAQGHDVTAHPGLLRRGQGFCRICAGRDSVRAWQAFKDRVAEFGGTVLELQWLGTNVPHRIRCGAGHESTPRPNAVANGKGICRTCARQEPKVAEAAFRALVEELGGTILEAGWLGRRVPHRVRCSYGHEVAIRPKSLTRVLCRMCSRRDPNAASAAFRSRVAQLGGIVLEPEWFGTHAKHRVRCSAGHECNVSPHQVMKGKGFCQACVVTWDVFYVVVDDAEGSVKVGITSGDPRPRLQVHARDNFSIVVRLLTGLPNGVAPDLERSVLAALGAAGLQPIRGREYFDSRALSIVLNFVDSCTIPRQSVAANPVLERQPGKGQRKPLTGR